MSWLIPAFLVTAAASALATFMLVGTLQRRAILDHPNPRSSHTRPTPRGGGIAVTAVILLAWAPHAAFSAGPAEAAVILGAVGLAVLSWIDDLRSLPPWFRLGAQALAVAAAMVWLAGRGPIFQGLLPPWLDVCAAAVLWLWFVNLFNFMDGIDGISGVEAAAIGLGAVVLALVDPIAAPDPWLGLAIAAAATGFLVWNWHPAEIFLGDVGSVPLGFLLGWLLLGMAADGLWAPALILPLYYLADATLTLGRRALRGERIWEAHRQHFYQRAVAGGLGHGQVSLAVLVADIALIGLAVAALGAPVPALAAAVCVVVLLLLWMRR